METLINHIPEIISTLLLAAFALMVITNIIVEVLKRATWEKLPTNVLATIVAIVLTLVAFFAACQIADIVVEWYMVAGAVVLGFFVAYAAMFSFDKLAQCIEQIMNITKK